MDAATTGALAHDAGLVVGPGPLGRCDDGRIGGPVVRRDAGGFWRLWYYCRDARFAEGIAPMFGTGSVATAVSDDGLNWTRLAGPLESEAVFGPSGDDRSFDALHVGLGDVLQHGDQWWMVYFGGGHEAPRDAPAAYRHPGCRMRLGLARSEDGIHWSRLKGAGAGGAIIDVGPGDIYAGFPALVHDGGRFLLYYTTVDAAATFWRTRIAVSVDGQAWQHFGDLQWIDDSDGFDSGGSVTRHVQPNPLSDEPRWIMTYTARDGRPDAAGRRSIALAGSSDALRWRRLHRTPVLNVGPAGAWDSAGVAAPCLIAAGEELRLYYYGWSEATGGAPGRRGIGCAVADGTAVRATGRWPASFRRLAPATRAGSSG